MSQSPPDPAADPILTDRPTAGVCRLILNRPGQRNALGLELGSALRQALARVAQDPSIRVLLLTGQGTAFCAGADLQELADRVNSAPDPANQLSQYYRAFLDLRDLPIPTIALVNGPAVGAGANLALSCDLRLFSETASLSTPFVRLGIHPGGGCTWLLTRIAGTAAARELLLLGGSLDSARALQLGLANRVVEAQSLQEKGLEWALRLSQLPRTVLLDLKATLNLAEAGEDFAGVLAAETAAQVASLAGANAREGWAAFRERRPAQFDQPPTGA